MIPAVTLSLPDVEFSFLSFAKVKCLFLGTESKIDLTSVKKRSS